MQGKKSLLFSMFSDISPLMLFGQCYGRTYIAFYCPCVFKLRVFLKYIHIPFSVTLAVLEKKSSLSMELLTIPVIRNASSARKGIYLPSTSKGIRLHVKEKRVSTLNVINIVYIH